MVIHTKLLPADFYQLFLPLQLRFGCWSLNGQEIQLIFYNEHLFCSGKPQCGKPVEIPNCLYKNNGTVSFVRIYLHLICPLYPARARLVVTKFARNEKQYSNWLNSWKYITFLLRWCHWFPMINGAIFVLLLQEGTRPHLFWFHNGSEDICMANFFHKITNGIVESGALFMYCSISWEFSILRALAVSWLEISACQWTALKSKSSSS